MILANADAKLLKQPDVRSVGEEQAASFEKVYYAVRFISKEAQLKEV